jgi:hypothetical protein
MDWVTTTTLLHNLRDFENRVGHDPVVLAQVNTGGKFGQVRFSIEKMSALSMMPPRISRFDTALRRASQGTTMARRNTHRSNQPGH